MKYAVLKVINGNFSVHAEGLSENGAKVNFHSVCQTLWNAPDVETAAVMIVDEQLRLVNGYHELITYKTETEE